MHSFIPLAPGLWTLAHSDFSVGGLRIGTRTTVAQLADGTLALHSPGPLTAEQFEGIASLGTVSTILAPSGLHHMFLAPAAARFPEARVYASPLNASRNPQVKQMEALGNQVPAPLAGSFDLLPLNGCPTMDERVIFHTASRSLLGVDLAFNIRNATGLLRFQMWLNNANDKFCVTRLGRSMYVKDARAAHQSVSAMVDAWDFDRILVSHGEVLDTDAKATLIEAWSFAKA